MNKQLKILEIRFHNNQRYRYIIIAEKRKQINNYHIYNLISIKAD